MNRKFAILLTLALVMALILPVTNAYAAPQTSPSGLKALAQAAGQDLAAYFKANSVVYLNLRIDDAHIDALDDILNKIRAKLPPNVIPPFTLRGLLEQQLRQVGIDYQADVRSWLGDRIAVGFGPEVFQGDYSKVIALAVITITDRAKAEAFLDKMLASMIASGAVTKSEGEVTSYAGSSPQFPVEIQVNADALLIGTPAGVRSTLTREAKLDLAPGFASAVGGLPAKDYNVLVYVNYPELIKAMPYIMTMQTPLAREMIGALGSLAVGGTILDDRSLVLDYNIQVDVAKMGEIGFSNLPLAPVDPAFAANLPANTVLVTHSTNLKAVWETIIPLSAASNPALPGATERALAQIREQLKQQLDLDLDNDILAWLTGDFAVFVGYDVPAIGDPESLAVQIITQPAEIAIKGLDAGVVIEATDPAKARNLVDKLTAALSKEAAKPNTAFKVSVEQIAGVDATVITVTTPPGVRPALKPFDFVIAANNRVFVAATRPAATAILGGNGGFDKKKGFVEAAKYVLPNANSVWYLDDGAVSLIVDYALAAQISSRRIFANITRALQNTPTPTPDPGENEALLREYQTMQNLGRIAASILSSATISTAFTDNGLLMRYVLTLGE